MAFDMLLNGKSEKIHYDEEDFFITAKASLVLCIRCVHFCINPSPLCLPVNTALCFH